ncbi:hypothetical protein REPUB_Repub18cG0000300 [Reevesia pubescens]
MKCQSKIKIFLWKTLHEALPTQKLLHDRHLISSTICFRCGERDESIIHVLHDCKDSKQTWLKLNREACQMDFFHANLQDWLLSNLSAQKTHDNLPWMIIFSTIIWLLWYWRNKCLHEKYFIWPGNTSHQILRKAKESWDAFGKYQNKLRYEQLVSWVRPGHGYVKINVDGSARGKPGLVVAGGVLRDENGVWSLGFTNRLGIANILTAELWAIYQGLSLSWDKGYRKVELETDSMVAVQKIKANGNNGDPNVNLIHSIKYLLQRDWLCSIKHTHREANYSADWMATHFDHLSLGLHIFDSPPTNIFSCLLADAIGVTWTRFM